MSENVLQVVDISKDDLATAEQLVKAASTLGFVMVEGSGFSRKDVDRVFQLSKQFFDLPTEDKNKVPINEDNHGYSAMNVEVLDPETQKKGDPKEAFNIAQDKNGGLSLDLPPLLSDNDEEVRAIWLKFHSVGERLLKLLARGLHVEPFDPDQTAKDDDLESGDNWFVTRHLPTKPSGSVLRFLHYPSQKSQDPETVIRAGAHTDYGTITMLFQKEGEDGLEIFSPLSKSWVPVSFTPALSNDPDAAPPLVVNIADLLSFWTAGVLKSTIHRVKFPKEAQITGKDRYSVVYFLHPQNSVPLEPVPSKQVTQITNRGPQYDAQKNGKYITALEHLQKRLAATYGWTGY